MTMTTTPTDSIYSEDIDVEVGADPKTKTSSPTPSIIIITPEHVAFEGSTTAKVEALFKSVGNNTAVLQLVADLLVEAKV